MTLSDISVTRTNSAVVVSGEGLFHKNDKKPSGFVVEIVLMEKDADGINKLLPVFLPYNHPKLHQLCTCVMNSPVFMAEITFCNFQFHKKKSGGYYATASDFTIIRGE